MLSARLQGRAKTATGLLVLALVLVLVLVLGGPARAAGLAVAEAARVARERAAIVAERDRIEAQFATELAACSDRFAVTACQDDVRARRRVALDGPRARELALDDAERRSRAAARREAVVQKQRRAAERPAPAAAAAPAPASAPAPAQPAPSLAPQLPETTSASRAAASAAAEAAAAQRALAARQRQAAIKAEQARIAARQAERERRGKSAAPLPVPEKPARVRPPAAPGSAPR